MKRLAFLALAAASGLFLQAAQIPVAADTKLEDISITTTIGGVDTGTGVAMATYYSTLKSAISAKNNASISAAYDNINAALMAARQNGTLDYLSRDTAALTLSATADTADQRLLLGSGLIGNIHISQNLSVAGNTTAKAGGTFNVDGYLSLTAENGARFNFSNNVVSPVTLEDVGNGGVIYINSSGYVSVKSADFSNNIVYATGILANNRGTGNGGAIDNNGVLYVDDSTFTGNQAVYKASGNVDNSSAGVGGAIRIGNGNAVTYISNSLFDSNVARHGGAILSQGQLYIYNSTFTNNITNKASGGRLIAAGGAIYVLNGTTVIENSTLSGNGRGTKEQHYGGAIMVESGTLTIKNSTLSGNKTSYQGGAIGVGSSANLNIENSWFIENDAAYMANSGNGGAIGGAWTTLSVTNTTFSGNYVLNRGGAIASGNSVTLSIKAINGGTTLFTGNLAKGVANSMWLGTNMTVGFHADTTSLIDLRDPFTGNTGTYSKTGAGTLKMGGQNTLAAGAGSTTFSINEGTVYLYKAGEVSNANKDNASAMVEAGELILTGADSTLQISSNATLQLGGGNTVSVEGILSLEGGASLHYDSGDSTITAGTLELVGVSKILLSLDNIDDLVGLNDVKLLDYDNLGGSYLDANDYFELANGVTGNFEFRADGLYVSGIVIPEPAMSAALLGIGALLVCVRRRK